MDNFRVYHFEREMLFEEVVEELPINETLFSEYNVTETIESFCCCV